MTIERLLAFGDAWNRRNVDDIMSYFAVECTYHASAGPEPGRTYQGREAVRRGVIEMLAYDRGGRSKTGPAFVADERGVAEWSYEFTAADGTVTVIRGCDVFEFEGDLIRRKDAFRKVYLANSMASLECCESPGRRIGSPNYDIYDALADLLADVIWNASAVKSPVDLCWSIQHNSLWADIFGSEDRNGPAAQIVKRKLMAEIYQEINEMKTFPNFKGAKYLGFCLNVMGLTLNREPSHRDSFPLQRAVLRWTKKNFALLHRRNPEVADACLVAGMSFNTDQLRIVKCYPVEGLRRQARYFYLPVDPAPDNAPQAEGI